MLLWQFCEPLVFVAIGMQFAPRKGWGFVINGGLKIFAAVFGLIGNLQFIQSGGSWQALDDITQSPVWWTAAIQIVCALALLAFGVYLLQEFYNHKKLKVAPVA